MTKKPSIETVEFYIILFFALFGISWISVVIPSLQTSDWFNSINPISAYIIYNIGIITLFTVTLGIPVGYFIHGKFDILDIVRGGVASFIGASWFIDNFQSPFAWDKFGNLLIIPTNQNLEITAVDYVWGWLFQQLGFHGSIIYNLVYVLVPILGIVTMTLILKPKELLRMLNL